MLRCFEDVRFLDFFLEFVFFFQLKVTVVSVIFLGDKKNHNFSAVPHFFYCCLLW